MPKVIICGTIGLDDVETPFGKVEGALGGSAVYASVASSFFAETGLVSIAGTDFPATHEKFLKDRRICLKGIEKKGNTFRWGGKYEYDMNEAKTTKTELNSLVDFNPILPEEYREGKYLFLANVDPVLQLNVLNQIKNPRFVMADTMNFWINTKKEHLLDVISKVDLMLLNDGEARQLFNTVNLVQAAHKALSLGPKFVIIKKGEHGALLFSKDKHFNAPAYPLEVVKDPTGCGDSFAGGMIGYLAKTDDTSEKNIRKGIVYGSTVASYNAEDFSLERLKRLSVKEIEERYKRFEEIREF